MSSPSPLQRQRFDMSVPPGIIFVPLGTVFRPFDAKIRPFLFRGDS
jgi:hypothetical protein